MRFSLTKGQLDRLANVCEDLAKGNILAALATPAISGVFDIFTLIIGVIVGLTFLYFTLSIEGVKEVL